MKTEEKVTDIEISESSQEEMTQNDSKALEKAVPLESNDTKNASKKYPPNLEKNKSRWWLSYVITFAVLAVITVLVAWIRDCYTETSTKILIRGLCDAFCVPGILGICFGLLVLASKGGAFDMISYGMRRFFGIFKKNPLDRKYRDYYEYKKAKREKKRSFWYLIIVGGVYLLVGLALLLVFYKI